MSVLKLNDVEIDPDQIGRVIFDKAGAHVGANAVTVSSGPAEDLTVPQDTLIVRLKDGTGLAVRGEQADEVFALLKRFKCP